MHKLFHLFAIEHLVSQFYSTSSFGVDSKNHLAELSYSLWSRIPDTNSIQFNRYDSVLQFSIQEISRMLSDR